MSTATDAATDAAAATYQLIEMGRIHESPLNPRKTFAPAKLDELATSIKAKGIITPLLLRPRPAALFEEDGRGRTRVRENLTGDPGFEIAAGHRRYRASLAVGLTHVPAVVRDMDDKTFLEILVMENDEREDLQELEEAEGYRTLIDKAGYTVERIAERKGCSVKYVYDRMKLLSLIPAAQQLLRDGAITAGHAILLARLKPADQERAIDQDEGGLLVNENVLVNPDEEDVAAEDPVKAVSVRELQGWIDEHVKFDTRAVDPMVFPETADALIAADKVVPITHNHHVPPEARDKQRVFGPRSWKRADGQAKSKPCDYARLAVIVIGPGRGDSFAVCIAKDRCDAHWGAERRERERRTVRGEVGGSQTGQQDRWKREEERRRQEQARADAEHARWKKALPAILEAVAAAVKKAPTKATGLLAAIILEQAPLDYGHKDHSGMVPRGASAEDLMRHAAFRILMDAAQDWSAWREFPKRAKAFGLDVGKIVDHVAPPPAASKTEAPKAAAGKRKPKKSAGKAQKK